MKKLTWYLVCIGIFAIGVVGGHFYGSSKSEKSDDLLETEILQRAALTCSYIMIEDIEPGQTQASITQQCIDSQMQAAKTVYAHMAFLETREEVTMSEALLADWILTCHAENTIKKNVFNYVNVEMCLKGKIEAAKEM